MKTMTKKKAEKGVEVKKTPSPKPVEEPNTVIEAVEEVIQHLENAKYAAGIAIQKLRQEEAATDRLVRSGHRIDEILKDIKPYLEG